ncbi:nitrogenase cofactor biosynthesis protein NifB [Vibrio hippocampi]|uniref:FeMo cofactor biosynthesis protein NifB n=1 Tax=Vibrio hippocampi TaxID=654686 RepID=A0ABN8DKX4_9VIBR|nr:nitrogenase cofactor biosynthesis protein NifB [Vibrio hippocampi]CAH0529333.1 FeMo cofactor biosynthesis protein NifB [Vibrio hippocampi]
MTNLSNQPDNHSVVHFFDKSIQSRIAEHPCYSKSAGNYARIHLPVAPACNIQCNYCNRKYDCSNESRPGVVSNLLSPVEALARFHAIKQRMPNLTVVGIAGPGDALANPDYTFKTLELIHQASPDVKLCISTNGLDLYRHVDRLAALGVDHLTVTINTTDPKIAAKIYPWIFWNHRRWHGEEAAELLIEQQLKGLKKAAESGMLVKVNTVLIPNINQEGIEALSEQLKHAGAMLHNIMPLISAPEHGTYFGLNHHPAPTEEEIAQARSQSVMHVPQMTHCQQCRADAVGTLDTACSTNQSTEDKYLVAVASKQGDVIDCHFGHATQFDIYQLTENEARFVETRHVTPYCNGQSECDQPLPLDALMDCKEVLSSRIGLGPWEELKQHGIAPNVDFAFMSIREALSLLCIAKLCIAKSQAKQVDNRLTTQQQLA